MAARHSVPDDRTLLDPKPGKLNTSAITSRPRLIHPWEASFHGIITSHLHFSDDLPDFLPKQLVPPEMRAAVKKRRAEFLAGQLCAQTSLKRAGFSSTMPTRNSDRSPLWPEGSAGSISHSRNEAIAIVGSTRLWKSLGVDIEHRAAPALASLLRCDIMGSAEDKLMTACFSDMHFERVFSVKEAAFKAIYPLARQMFEFRDIEIVSARADGRLTLQLLRDLDRSWRTGSTITAYHRVMNDVVFSIAGIPAET